MTSLAVDHVLMLRALELARRGLYTSDPNPRVGCVVAQAGEVIGEGFHARAGGDHAEVVALQQAGSQACGATVYVTLEPCNHTGRTPPCVQRLIEARVARVVAAQRDPNPHVHGAGLDALRAAGVETDIGVLEDEARALNPGFNSRMRCGRPWVRLKSALSLDGRTAMASGESQWITGPAARQDVQTWRARSSAIVTGSGTVLADDPSLNVRLSSADLDIEGAVRQPLRVVLDSGLKTSPQARLLGLAGDVLILTASAGASASTHLADAGAEVVAIERARAGLDLDQVMAELARREINEVLVEAGPGLVGALIQKQLFDELIVFLAPHLMGAEARGMAILHGLERMTDRVPLSITDLRGIGEDVRIIAEPIAELGKSP